MCSRRLLTLGGSIAVSLLVAGSALAQLPSADQKCIDGYNNFLRLVSAQAGKSATSCVKTSTKDASDPNTCIVTNTDGKIAGKAAKVNALYSGGKCTGAEVIQQGAPGTTGINAHVNAITNLMHDIFGSPVGALSNDKVDAKCLQKAVQRSTQAFTAVMLAERGCKKNGMKSGAITSEATLDSTCGSMAQIDPANKAGSKLAKISADVSAACAATTTPLPTLFDGLSPACTANAAALGTCLEKRTKCQVCFTLNTADGESLDCDLFDDGLANGSCFIPINVGTHTCNLAPTSQINLGTQALPLGLNPTGSISIACGTTDGTGSAACSCNIVSFGVLVIPSIGDVCIHPTSCPSGEIDCNGGNPEDVDLVVNHKIGTCTNDTTCRTACDTYCAGLGGYSRTAYGCEGFCNGGTNNNNACTADSQCPGGQCAGADTTFHANTCNCSCQGEGLGGASPAGSLSCELGNQIDVELPSNGACGDPVTIALPAVCGAVTTTLAKGLVMNANNTPAKTIPPIGGMGTAPDIQTGVGIDCNTASSSTLTGLTMVGHLGFYDSTLGDIFSTNKFICQ